MRRGSAVESWIAKFVIATTSAAVITMLPLGSSSVQAAGSNHESASTLVRDACDATLGASAFRVHGHFNQAGTSASIDLRWGSTNKVINFTQHGNQTVNVIIVGPSTYYKANRSFWQSQTKDAATISALAGRWIDMTADQKDAANLTKSFTKQALLSSCNGGESSATYVGKAAVNGVKVTKVHANSKNESDTYYIENGSTPYILRLSGSPSQKNSGDVVFSSYGVQPNVAAPAGAIPISQILGNSGGTGNTGGTGNSGSTGNTGGGVQQADPVKACEADYKSLEVAVAAYNATVGSNPVPPAAWSASSYASNFGPLESSRTKGGPYLHSAPDPTHYVIEYDGHGNVWIEPAGTYDAKYNPAHAASDKVCASILR